MSLEWTMEVTMWHNPYERFSYVSDGKVLFQL